MSYFWSINNSIEFLNKISDVQIAECVETYDFTTLYTSLPLDDIYTSLEHLIIKMFRNSGSHGMMINAVKKKAFWGHGVNYSGYKEYTIDKLLDALKFILYHTYVQFGGFIFKQIQGIPMRGNASPCIADLYLSWHEFCFMDKLHKSKLGTDHVLAKSLSKNSRYIDDIIIINFLNFGSIAEQIYHPSLLLEKTNLNFHYDTFLDLDIRVNFNKFIIGIYHKIDDFSFNVICYPFPDSNVHTTVGYTVFYSQLVRYFRLCNNFKDFSARVDLIYKKLTLRGYKDKTLFRYFLKFCSRYPVLAKFGFNDSKLLWLATKKQSCVSCNCFDEAAISEVVRPCKIVLTDFYAQETSIYVPKSYLGSVTSQTVYAQGTSINAPKSNIGCMTSQTVKVQHESSELGVVKPQSVNFSSSMDSSHGRSYTPCPLANPKNQCYLNSAFQLLCKILSEYQEAIHINDSHEGFIFKKILDFCGSVHADSDFSEIIILLAKFNNFFDGTIQRDAHECFMLLTNLIHIATRECLVDNFNGVHDESLFTSFIKKSFYFTTRNTLTCLTCAKSNISFSESSFVNIYPTIDSNISSLFEESLSNKLTKFCEVCFVDSVHEENMDILQPPKFLCFIINRTYASDYAHTRKIKVMNSLKIEINSSEYNLIGSIHHHGNSFMTGHYTANIYFSDFYYLCNDSHITKYDNCDEISDTAYVVLFHNGN